MRSVIPLKVIDIDGGQHFIIKSYINGKVARLILDTGASKTVFDKSLIIKYVKDEKFELHDQISTGLGTGSMESHSTTLKKIRIGDVVILDFKTILLDLSHINQSYHNADLPQIEGVLGNDILLKYKVVIDFEKRVLILKYKKD